jgi:hypothetical protein
VPTEARLRYVSAVPSGGAFLASAASFAVLLGAVVGSGCSRGEGTGCASGTLNIPNCWAGDFDLRPTFFAAIPAAAAGSLLIRAQNGGDYESFSDGIAFDIDDIGAIRGDPLSDGTPEPSLLCPCSASSVQCVAADAASAACPLCAVGAPGAHRLIVSLPPSVTPPGVPVQATLNPSIVHATLYLQHTCRTQNLALYAMAAVTLNPDGSCLPPLGSPSASSCGAPAVVTPDAGADAATLDATAGGAPPDAGGAPPATSAPVIGTSTISFHDLFDGNENESSAQQRLSYADFDLYFADPRESCGSLGPPPPCRGHLTGNFNFYFERGQPAQPFP